MHQPTPSHVYDRPPITESIIELRVQQEVGDAAIDAIAARLTPLYPVTTTMIGLPELVLDTTGASLTVNNRPHGRRLVSEDAADVVLLTPRFLSTARLPSYPGWAALRDRARDNWAHWLAVAGSLPLERIGVRYINRIDIPVEAGQNLDLDQYLTFAPRGEVFSAVLVGYHVQMTFQTYKPHWMATVRSTPLPPSVPERLSVLLDIDVFRNILMPDAAEPWTIIDEAQEIKNDIFERALGAKARELFKA